MKIKRCLLWFTVVVTLLWSNLTAAQEMYNEVEQGITTGADSISHEEWFIRTNNFITAAGLPTHVQNLSYALVFAFLAYSLIQAAVIGSTKGLKQIFLRLIIVGAVFATLDQSREVLYTTWKSSLSWSEGISGDVLSEVAGEAGNVSLLLAPIGGMLAAGRMAGARLGKNTLVNATAKNVNSKLSLFLSTTTLLLIPVLAVYSIVIYSTGLIVLLSMLFLPLAAAFLVISNGSWLWKWLSAYLAAIFIVLFVPIIFSIAADLAITQPLKSLGEFLETSQDHFISAMDGFQTPEGASAWNVNKWREWANGLDESALAVLRGIMSAVVGWIIALAMMIFGIFAGVYLMLKIPSYIGSYMGSSASGSLVVGAAGAAGAGFLTARLRGNSGDISSNSSRSALPASSRTDKALPQEIQGGRRN